MTMLRTAGLLASVGTLVSALTGCGSGGEDRDWEYVPRSSQYVSVPPPPPPPPPTVYARICTESNPAVEAIGPFRTYAGDCILSYQLDEAERRLLSRFDDSLTTEVHRKVVDAFRSRFRDEFDYLVLLWDGAEPPPEAPSGMFSRAVDGRDDRCIAVLRTDCPRFLGTVTITFSLRASGNDGLNGGPLLHEMAHAVGNFVLPTTWPSHWGHAGIWGQLGGWDPATLKDLGGGQYQVGDFGEVANYGNSIPYAPLELYLMGLVPESDVAPIKVANDLQWVDRAKAIFTASSFSTFTVQQLAEMLGERRPDMKTARKIFRIATIVLTADPRLSDDRARHISMGASYFTHSEPLTEYVLSTNSNALSRVVNFRAATRGLADARMAGVSTYAK